MSMIRNVCLPCALLVSACGSPDAATGQASGNAGQALTVAAGPHSVSFDYAQFWDVPGGVAGGESVVFVGLPLNGRVVGISRSQGVELGDLPPPPGGFALPFIMHKERGPGKLAVLDAGGFPSPEPFIPANPSIHEYSYSVSSTGALSATLERTVSFAGNLVGFAEDIVSIDGGRYLLSDTILGRIWVVEADGTVRPGIGPRTDAPEDAIPELAYCPTMPLVEVGGIPFLFSGSTQPGVESLAVQDGVAYFNSPCAGAVYSFPVSILDDAREPWDRAGDLHEVSRKPDGVAIEQLLGLTFNPYDASDRWLYAADSLQLQIIRIDPVTGTREVVASDPSHDSFLFDFPSSTSFLPPIAQEPSVLVVVSNQQHRLTFLNDAIHEDLVRPPFHATKVMVH